MQRFLLPAWVGAAILFVVTSVAEQQFPDFASSIKNQLALIRFPKYYAFGFVILITSLLCSVGRLAGGARDKGTIAVFALLAITNLMMAADFQLVYRPLADIMVDLLRPRDDEFAKYHQMSKYVNAVEIVLCVVAAIILCREPARPAEVSPNSERSR